MPLKNKIRDALSPGLLASIRLLRMSVHSPRTALELAFNPPEKSQKAYWFNSQEDYTSRLERYYESALSAPHRRLIADEIDRLLPALTEPVRILDFGSFAGANLRVLAEKLQDRVDYRLYATDPHPGAVKFIQETHPDAQSYCLNDRDFVRSHLFKEEKLSIGLICFVLSYIPSARVLRLFRKMASLTQHLILYEGLLNIEGSRSFAGDQKGNRPGNIFYYHPYRRMLCHTGWRITKIVYEGDQIANGGIILATRSPDF